MLRYLLSSRVSKLFFACFLQVARRILDSRLEDAIPLQLALRTAQLRRRTAARTRTRTRIRMAGSLGVLCDLSAELLILRLQIHELRLTDLRRIAHRAPSAFRPEVSTFFHGRPRHSSTGKGGRTGTVPRAVELLPEARYVLHAAVLLLHPTEFLADGFDPFHRDADAS